MKTVLTIAIVTWNGEKYISELFESIKCQDLENVEILVADNGSVDSTQSICEAESARFEDFKYFRHARNIGIKNNIEFVIESSSSDYVWLCADDDLISVGAVKKIKDLIKETPGVILCNFSTIDDKGNLIQDNVQGWVEDKIFSSERAGHAYVACNHSYGLISSIILSKPLWLSLPEEYLVKVKDDFNFLLKIPGIMSKGGAILVATPLVKFRKYLKKWQTVHSYSETFNIDHLVMLDIFDKLLFAGFDKISVNKMILSNLKGFPQSIFLIRKNNNKISLNIWIKFFLAYGLSRNLILGVLIYLTPYLILVKISKIKYFDKYRVRL